MVWLLYSYVFLLFNEIQDNISLHLKINAAASGTVCQIILFVIV